MPTSQSASAAAGSTPGALPGDDYPLEYDSEGYRSCPRVSTEAAACTSGGSMTATLTIDAPAVSDRLSSRHVTKGRHGGRDSGKSWQAATMLVTRCLQEPGIRVVCPRDSETLAESAKRLIEDRIASLGVGHMFRIQQKRCEAGLEALAWYPRDWTSIVRSGLGRCVIGLAMQRMRSA